MTQPRNSMRDHLSFSKVTQEEVVNLFASSSHLELAMWELSVNRWSPTTSNQPSKQSPVSNRHSPLWWWTRLPAHKLATHPQATALHPQYARTLTTFTHSNLTGCLPRQWMGRWSSTGAHVPEHCPPVRLIIIIRYALGRTLQVMKQASPGPQNFGLHDIVKVIWGRRWKSSGCLPCWGPKLNWMNTTILYMYYWCQTTST